ncbi:restriction endonuclease subunit S [Vibrio breoganii]
MSFDKLPSGWQLIPLEDAMDAIIDYRGKTPKKTESGIPLITAKIVKGGYVLEPFEFIAEDNYDSWMVRGLPQVGDVVLTTEAPLGETAQLTSANVALAQRIVTLRGKKGLLDNDFLLCALQSDFVQHQLESRASGSTVKGIKQSELRKVSLPIPPLPEQQKISQALKSLSNRLVCNIQTNQTLEEMAQAIFKSWFVDFDPVKAKMNGEQPEGMDAATASLFPEKLVESELGLIPEGWEVKPLDKVAHFQNGLALQKFRPESEDDDFLPVLKIAQLRQGYCDGKEKARTDIKESCRVYDGDMIFSWSGTLMIDLWTGGNVALNQHLFKVTSEEYNLPLYLYWTKHHLAKFQQIAKDKAVTMGHIKRGHLSESLCVIPPKALRDKMDEVLLPLINQGLNLRLQSNQLATLRDTLLPKLLSGEIELETATENK